MPVFAGDTAVSDHSHVAIIVSRYNENITERIREGAVATLVSRGIVENQIDVIYVPGAWEIPLVAQRACESQKYDGLVCLGAVIKGETTHDQHINHFVSTALGDLSLEYDLPIGFGLLTCNNMEQAIQRAGGNVGNKGEETANAVCDMMSLLAKMENESDTVD